MIETIIITALTGIGGLVVLGLTCAVIYTITDFFENVKLRPYRLDALEKDIKEIRSKLDIKKEKVK